MYCILHFCQQTESHTLHLLAKNTHALPQKLNEVSLGHSFIFTTQFTLSEHLTSRLPRLLALASVSVQTSGFQQLGFHSIPQGTGRKIIVTSCLCNFKPCRKSSYFRKLNHWDGAAVPRRASLSQLCKLFFRFVWFAILAAGFGSFLMPLLLRLSHQSMRNVERPGFYKFFCLFYRYQLNKMVVDTNAGPYGNHTVLFLGSSRGTILKFLVSPNRDNTVSSSNIFLEELEGYNPDRYWRG